MDQGKQFHQTANTAQRGLQWLPLLWPTCLHRLELWLNVPWQLTLRHRCSPTTCQCHPDIVGETYWKKTMCNPQQWTPYCCACNGCISHCSPECFTKHIAATKVACHSMHELDIWAIIASFILQCKLKYDVCICSTWDSSILRTLNHQVFQLASPS